MNDPITHCPWCSADVPDPAPEHCPSCGAALVAAPGTDKDIRGITTLDPEAIAARPGRCRPATEPHRRSSPARSPSRWIPSTNPESLAPPDTAVRREMLRLQLEAERADQEAETVALKSDVLTKQGISLSELAAADEAVGADDAPTQAAAESPAAAAEVDPPAVDEGTPPTA